jgi:putative membrane protein
MTIKPQVDRQREHQANERTFLAWLRTSVALICFGFAIARFGIFLRQLQMAVTQQEAAMHPVLNSENLGVSLVIFGIVVIALAAWRYNRVFWQIERGDYRPNRLMVWITSGVVIILGLLSLPLVFWRNRIPISPASPNSQQQSQKLRSVIDQSWVSGILIHVVEKGTKFEKHQLSIQLITRRASHVSRNGGRHQRTFGARRR